MSEGKTTVAVLGGGRWARALAMNLCRNQDHVARVLHYRRERAAAAAPPLRGLRRLQLHSWRACPQLRSW